MDSMDLQASIHNLLQMDRHQEEVHRTPVAHQAQNAEIAREEEGRRTEMPNEPEQSEGKNVDSESRKRYHREAGRRKREQKKRRQSRGRAAGAGRFVDVTV
ncbi:MAG: hypothetical protein GF418_00290 [Chitinivibrionales bacterium]|nr:hypothetical protein [Chitinivibrionales bacterium]MBD3394038.1 hypothetical protein [Chitinivibrionales bacterium]